MEDTTSTAFLLPKLNSDDEQLVGLHLSLPVGFVDSAPYFCMATEAVTDLANQYMPVRNTAPPQLMEGYAAASAETDDAPPDPAHDRKWAQIPQNWRAVALEKVDVYLDDFIYTCQGGRSKRTQMVRHLFQTIYAVFYTNGRGFTEI